MKINKDKIELIIAKKGLSYADVAKKIGMTRQNFSHIKCRGTCTPKTAVRIAKGLGVELEEFIEI
jgi:plasmid maintenance system antidote protein VapI